jgi:flagella basal body P-ring formation protein FlgA
MTSSADIGCPEREQERRGGLRKPALLAEGLPRWDIPQMDRVHGRLRPATQASAGADAGGEVERAARVAVELAANPHAGGIVRETSGRRGSRPRRTGAARQVARAGALGLAAILVGHAAAGQTGSGTPDKDVAGAPDVAIVAVSGPAEAGAAARVSAEAAARIGEAWNVAPESVRLDWGGGAAETGGNELVRILGRGRDGWFAAVLRDAAGRRSSVRLRAGIAEPVMVATRDLGAGLAVGPGDLQPSIRVRWGPPTADAGERPGPGWEVRRPLAAGDIAMTPSVRPPVLVRAGEPVTLRWQHDVVRLTASGIALNSARAGEPVRIEVAGRERPLHGRVTGRGLAAMEEASR